jgi:hyperosmotically inducible periplasmic protein
MRKHVLPTVVIALGFLAGCSTQPKSPDVSNQIRNSLDQAGLKDVSLSQDRDKGVITLTGTTPSEADKNQAELIAKSAAPSDVVSNQIAVRPPGDDGTAKKVDSALDKGIEKNLDAVLFRHKLDKTVKYDVKNGVVTLTGNVRSQSQRDNVEKLAKGVPNVQQVVNEIEVKNQKASSSD